MKQKDNDNAGVVFGSISGLLREIHNEQLTIQNLVSDISDTIEYSTLSVSNILRDNVKLQSLETQILREIKFGIFSLLQSLGNGAFDNMLNVRGTEEYQWNVVTLISDIKTLLSDYLRNASHAESSVNAGNSQGEMSGKINSERVGNVLSNALNSSILTDNMIQILYDVSISLRTTNIILTDILGAIQSLNGINSNTGNVTQSVKTRNEEFNKLLESFTQLEKQLSDKFIKNFNEFVKYYQTFIDEKNTGKLRTVSVTLNMFSGALRAVSFLMMGVKKTFTSLSVSIMFLTLSLVNPLFTAAMSVLYGVMKGLRATFGDLKTAMLLPKTMTSIGVAIAVLVGGLFLIQKVSFSTLGKFMVFLTGLLAIFKLFGGSGGAETPSLTDAFAGKKTIVKNKTSVGGIFTAALGLALLASVLHFTENIDFAKASLLTVFISGLAISMTVTRKISRGNEFMKLSLSLSILILAVAAVGEVNWVTALALISGFVIGIGIVMLLANKMMGSSKGLGRGRGLNMIFAGNNVSMQGLFGFSLGLAILLLTVDAIQEVNWKSTIILLGFIAAISTAIAFPGLISKGKMNGQPVGGMLGFSVGIAILLLTVDACSEVNWDNAWKLVLFIGALVLEFKLLTYGLKSGKDIMLASGALVVATVGIIGCLKLFENVRTDYGTLIFFGISSFVFVSVTRYISANSSAIVKSVIPTFKLAVEIGILTGAIYLVNRFVTVDYGKLIFFGIASIGLIEVIKYASNAQSQITKGALAVLAVSGVTLVLSFALKQILELNLDILQFLEFLGAITVLTLTMAAASLIAIPAAIGAAGVLAVAVTTIASALALSLISKVNISEQKITEFGSSVEILMETFASIGLVSATIAVTKAGLVSVVSAVSILTSGALTAITLLNIRQDKIKEFGSGINSLINSYDSIGLVSSAKAVAKAGMLTIVAGASTLIGLAFKFIDSLDIRKDALSNFGKLMEDFLDTTIAPINKAADKLKEIQPALESLMKLVSISRGLIDVVESYANMKIGVWTYNRTSGKMEISGYKKVDNKVFGEVGRNIGKLLQGLIEPLTIITSDAEVWNFNGVKVRNPFKGGWFGTDNNSGVKRIEKIGNAFGGLIRSMNGLSANRMLSGYWKDFLRFKGMFNMFIGMMVSTINRFENVNSDGFGNHGKQIADFFGYMNKISDKFGDEKSSLARQVNELMMQLSDKVKWNTINNQLNRTQKNIDAIVKSINKISVQKATMLQRNLQLLSNANTAQQLRRCIAEIEQLISTIVEYQDRQEQASNRFTNVISEAFGVDKAAEKTAEKNGIVYENDGTVNRSKTDIKALLTQIMQLLGEMRYKQDKQADLDVYVTNINELKSVMLGAGKGIGY